VSGFPLKLGSQGVLVNQLDAKAKTRYASYATEIDGVTPLKEDAYFGKGEQRFAETWQARMHRPVTGQITEDEFNYIVKGIDFPVAHPLKVGWKILTHPGSGADANVGPSYEVGKWVEAVHGIQHYPVVFLKGGYMGALGGDASASYVDVTWSQYKSIEAILDRDPDVQEAMRLINSGVAPAEAIRRTNLNLILSAYSQSADGLEDALEMLFGDGGFVHPGDQSQTPSAPGKYRALRGAIRRVIQFGNPSRQPGQMSGQPGWNPKGWGIARKRRPAWLVKVVVSITNPNDFYACVPDSDDIRPVFYAEIITSSAKLPYFVHLLNIGIQVAAQWIPIVGPILGSFSPVATSMLAGFAQLGPMFINQLGGLMGQAPAASHDTDVDAKLVQLLSAQGIFTHLDDLVGLVGDLPGLNNHGMYHVPFAELGNRSGIQVGCDEVNLVVAGKL
jgi:hypothetical protein